jgi:hypothetical protein
MPPEIIREAGCANPLIPALYALVGWIKKCYGAVSMVFWDDPIEIRVSNKNA